MVLPYHHTSHIYGLHHVTWPNGIVNCGSTGLYLWHDIYVMMSGLLLHLLLLLLLYPIWTRSSLGTHPIWPRSDQLWHKSNFPDVHLLCRHMGQVTHNLFCIDGLHSCLVHVMYSMWSQISPSGSLSAESRSSKVIFGENRASSVSLPYRFILSIIMIYIESNQIIAKKDFLLVLCWHQLWTVTYSLYMYFCHTIRQPINFLGKFMVPADRS